MGCSDCESKLLCTVSYKHYRKYGINRALNTTSPACSSTRLFSHRILDVTLTFQQPERQKHLEQKQNKKTLYKEKKILQTQKEQTKLEQQK